MKRIFILVLFNFIPFLLTSFGYAEEGSPFGAGLAAILKRSSDERNLERATFSSPCNDFGEFGVYAIQFTTGYHSIYERKSEEHCPLTNNRKERQDILKSNDSCLREQVKKGEKVARQLFRRNQGDDYNRVSVRGVIERTDGFKPWRWQHRAERFVFGEKESVGCKWTMNLVVTIEKRKPNLNSIEIQKVQYRENDYMNPEVVKTEIVRDYLHENPSLSTQVVNGDRYEGQGSDL